MAQKADDISGGFACASCHDAIDGRAGEFVEHKDWYLRRAQTRTTRKLLEIGVLRIA